MTDASDRLEQLERRVKQLEALVRQLADRALATPAAGLPPTAPSPSPSQPHSPAPTPRPVVVRAAMPAPAPRDWEQWVGRRALLGVGVLALIATAGFFLKYAIDRGWISPWVRVNGGVLLGAFIALWGDRLVARGLRLYGGAIIGAGGALAYLAIWAAAAPYGLIAPDVGVILLLGVTLGVAARAVRYRVEALCAWALLGALCAPFFVRPPSTDIARLLAYLGVITGGCGGIAARLRWRRTFALAVAGFFLMPLLAPAAQREVPELALYLAAGGIAVLLVTERRRWPESRLGGFVATWIALTMLAGAPAMAAWRWHTLAAALLLALVAWRHHVTTNPFAVDPVEIVVFMVSPLAAVALAAGAGPPELARAGGVVPAALAIPYLAAGWPRRSLHLVAMGFTLMALAIAGQWDHEPVAVGWMVLALLGVAADRWSGQTAGRPAATVLATLGLMQLFLTGLAQGVFDAPPTSAFRDGWSLAWYACTAACAAAAAAWRSPGAEPAWLRGGRVWLWGVAGMSIWLGGSWELSRAFTDQLARDLAISAFWLLYAGALVATGFRLGQRAARIAGLALAGVAALKIVLYDLSQLEALYRVGSFFVLAVITLAVAYAYNRRRLTESSQQ